MRESTWFHGAAVLCLLLPASAAAEEQTDVIEREALIEETSVGEAIAETAHPGWTYPKAYAQRPLVMDKHMLRGTFSVDVKRLGLQSLSGVRQTLVALDFGDMPICGRYSFLRKDYAEMGLDLVMVIPSNTNFATTFGVPVRI